MKTQLLLLLALALGTVASAQTAAPPAQTPPAADTTKLQTVLIQVNDPSGAVIPGALVRLMPLPDGMQTDQAGQLTLQLKPGLYGILVDARGFSGYNGHFNVIASEPAQKIAVGLQIPAGPDLAISPPGPPPPLYQPTAVFTLTIAPSTDKLRIGQEDLKRLPRKSVLLHNPHSNTDEKYEGVLLADLLEKYGAPLGKDLRGPALTNYVVATGADGYKVVYSLAELDPSFHPGDVILADTMDGQSLDARTGPLRLVSTEDKRPARSVRNLVVIEVKAAQ